MEVHNNSSEPWSVALLNTGLVSMTGGRVKRAKEFVGEEPFLLTYDDGVADLNRDSLLQFHNSHGKVMTMTSAQPDGRFWALGIDLDSKIKACKEKPKGDGSRINAGCFVCEPKVFDYIKDGESSIFEQAPLMDLAEDSEVYTFKHEGCWMPMDTLRDRVKLNDLRNKKKAT